MKAIEMAPFAGYYQGFGLNSCDSVVGHLKNKELGKDYVIKWNRRYFPTKEEAFGVCKFIKKSLALYEVFLGSEFLVPTWPVVGQKKDSIVKYKAYIIQPYIDGWTAKNLPSKFREKVEDQWNILNSRLFNLYNAGFYVGKHLKDPASNFPITLTVGSSRRQALIGEAGG